MNKVLTWFKEHPLEGAALVVGVIVLFFLLRSSSSSTAAATNSNGLTGAQQAQLDAASLQASTQLQEVQTQAGAAATNTAAQVTVAGLEASTQQNADTLSAQTSQQIATLEAQVQDNQTSAAVQENQAQTAALEAIALAPYQVEEDEINSTSNGQITALESQLSNLTDAYDTFATSITSPGAIVGNGLAPGELVSNTLKAS